MPSTDYMRHVNVMVADPDRQIRSLVVDVLQKAGIINIAVVDNGKKAIAVLREKDIDLLITDWRMMPVDGIQLIDYIRSDPNSPNTFLPIIMLTGKAERKDVTRARDTGVTEFLVKPFSAKTLFERLVMVIENPRSFVLSDHYRGPDRRRRTDIPPSGKERRGVRGSDAENRF